MKTTPNPVLHGIRRLLLFVFVGLATARVDAQDPGHAVLEVQAQRFEAMVRSDIRRLEELLSPDLVYTHTSGSTESKAEFLTTLRSGRLSYLSITPSDQVVRILGEVAVSAGRSAMRINSQGREQAFAIRYLEVYARRDGVWLLIAWQSTRLPDEQ